ncbi:hypothetical protein HMPREF3189_01517 [Clostridiales bacterium KA00134]|nr:hypothetical protein HMPREF3189_01517 [Clostridiales bacterium KA00134]
MRFVDFSLKKKNKSKNHEKLNKYLHKCQNKLELIALRCNNYYK